mmetsp:Transcript_22225/g.62540  ORF Transcript_22225/g.62540 Transcript_22225/m.62540 type:complete len:180 (-) Transcript_22225:346-885(-)
MKLLIAIALAAAPSALAMAPYVPEVESSLTFTVGTKTNAEGQGGNGDLYVKLWSGATPIPLSPTVSVPAYTGTCDTTYRDDGWTGPSGWLNLDEIDVQTKGITSSQSLGPLDPTLPLTHIELYYNQNDAVQVAGVTIQVGDTSYGLPASWSLENWPSGDGWLETNQSCVWWVKIDMELA